MRWSVFILCLFLFSLSFAQKDISSKKGNDKKIDKQQISISTSSINSVTNNNQEDKKNISSKKEEKNEDEYSEVLVDKMENNQYEDISYNDTEEEKEKKNDEKDEFKIPFSYGAVKGVLNDGQRNILVLESEDGTITFIQIFWNKGGIRWKLLNQIMRN